MKGYSTSEVARLLGLSQPQIRGYVRAGFLSPEKGSRGELSFFLGVYRDDVEVERQPAHRSIETVVPDERFEARHWTA